MPRVATRTGSVAAFSHSVRAGCPRGDTTVVAEGFRRRIDSFLSTRRAIPTEKPTRSRQNPSFHSCLRTTLPVATIVDSIPGSVSQAILLAASHRLSHCERVAPCSTSGNYKNATGITTFLVVSLGTKLWRTLQYGLLGFSIR